MISIRRWTRGEKRSFAGGLALFVAGSAGLFTMQDSLQAEAGRRRTKSDIQQVAGSPQEEAMEKAMDQAVESLDKFEAILKAPKKNQEQFAVKFIVEVKDEAELLWLSDITFDKAKETFTGKVANVPTIAKHLMKDQKITIKEDDVVDWMFVEDGKLQGGYTIRVQRQFVQAAERKKWEENFKFKFE